MSTSPVYINLEFTPNPNTLKYSVNRTLVEKGARNFLRPQDAAQDSPLAAKLFDVPGISGVMIGRVAWMCQLCVLCIASSPPASAATGAGTMPEPPASRQAAIRTAK